MRTLTVCRDRTFSSDIAPEDISDVLESGENVVWLDIEAPNEQDIHLLREEFGFHPLAVEDATRTHERPKVDAYQHAVLRHPLAPDDEQIAQPANNEQPGRQAYYFIVFYEAEFDPQHGHVTAEAINMFVGPNYLVTVHQGPTHTVQATLARWKAPDSPLGSSVGALVHSFLDAIVDDYFPLMDHVADRVEELEDTIFERFNEAAIQSIFGLKKDLLSMRRIVAPERDVLNVLLRRELPIFTPEDVAYMQDVYDHIVRVTDNIDTYRDLLSSALGFLPVAPVEPPEPDRQGADHCIHHPDGRQPGHGLLRHELRQHARAALGHRQPLGPLPHPCRRRRPGNLLQEDRLVVARAEHPSGRAQ